MLSIRLLANKSLLNLSLVKPLTNNIIQTTVNNGFKQLQHSFRGSLFANLKIFSPPVCIPPTVTRHPSTIQSIVLSGNTINLKSIFSEMIENAATWLIKRTFQPSIIRKRRKTGFLKRQKSVGGRKMLKRRMLKGRARLAGC